MVPEIYYCELCRLSRADPYVSDSSKPSYFINISTGKCDVWSTDVAFCME